MTVPERQDLLGDSEAGPSLRFLSLRVTIYERLVRETNESLEKLSQDSRASHHVSSEYRNDLEFLQTGLTKALEQLAVEHGLLCHRDAVQVCLPQLRENLPKVDTAVSLVTSS